MTYRLSDVYSFRAAVDELNRKRKRRRRKKAAINHAINRTNGGNER